VVVPLDPCWTVRLVGLREMVKSGAAVTVRLRFAVLVRLPLVARTWRL
jgi:hypothetical protein